MAQVFSRRFVLLLRVGSLGALVAIVTAAVTYRVTARTDAAGGAPIAQPIPFSHQHHVRDDGIDCRYCHTSVEKAAFAGLPPLSTCMTCHSQLFATAPILDPLRRAYAGDAALQWNRVYDLPLRAEMVKRQASYAWLVEKLAAIGVRDTEANLRNKISWGGFTGAFLIQCLDAIGCRSLQLSD